MGMSVQVELDEETKHRNMAILAQIRGNIEDELKAELDAIMEKVKDAAISLCPKETGALASSIEIDNSGSVQVGDFYGNSISAGNENIINPVTGKSTAEYALFVHDGHAMPDGSFWSGVPFLSDALAAFEAELEDCVTRAISELGSIEPSASQVAEQSD